MFPRLSIQNRIATLSLAALGLCAGVIPCAVRAQTTSVRIDAKLNQRPINPLIYGQAFATAAQLKELGATANRWGGNNTTRYNWKLNAINIDFDWYFESQPFKSAVAGFNADDFIGGNKNAGAASLINVPLIEWIAKLGANRSILSSFSVKKYGAQQQVDPWNTDAGNGVKKDGTFITGNDPNDANVPSNSTFQQDWVKHIVGQWGTAAKGGVGYYMMDNESSLWHSTHRDVHPTGLKMDEYLAKVLDYAAKIRAVDPTAKIVAPEEWGWGGYQYSGYDQQYGSIHGWSNLPDRKAHNNQDYMPWLLGALKADDTKNNRKSIDVFSLHYYPQGGEFSEDVSTATQLKRNRSTRSLWDPNYVDETWVNSVVQLIPRMKGWVANNYPGLPTAITEYNWGAEMHINGATAQADVLGIFGREGLDMATHWPTPNPAGPAYKACKLYRNYDGLGGAFGDVSVSATAPDPDNVSAFAALRKSDGALTLMVINKSLTTTATPTLPLLNFVHTGVAHVYQLTSTNQITNLSDLKFNTYQPKASLPAQSVTLYVFPGGTQSSSFSSSASASPGTVNAGSTVTLSTTVKCSSGSLTNGIIDLEVYDSKGNMVLQNYWIGQNIALGGSKTLSVNWSAPSSGSGLYTVAVGVFNTNWVTNLHWNGQAGSLNVIGKDSAQYNFESSAQGWATSGGVLTGVAQSNVVAFAGAGSLAVNFNSAKQDQPLAYVKAPGVAAGKKVTFHVWFPSGSTLTAVQPFVQQGATGGWTWTGNWQAISSLTPNAWNTITVTVPANAVTPLDSLGVQFFTGAGNWKGTCYIDAVGW